MEKITCHIGKRGPLSTRTKIIRTTEDDARWLMRVLEISWKRALELINKLELCGFCCTQRIKVDLDYRQYARYAAARRCDQDGSLRDYWCSPTIYGYEVSEPEPEEPQSLELRPGRRTRP